ncbi:hypothetical protein ACS0TY_003042 [Phlomoides rotata]
MAFSNFQAFMAIMLLLVPLAAKGDDVPPGLAPFYDELCKEVECGRGSCEAAPGSPSQFKCNCENGWKRTRLDDQDENDLEFLPCIIPNCTVDYSCMPAPPPAPPIPRNSSTFFDPCQWIYCGEGTCSKNKSYSHTCQCNPGYSNLLNISAFPCYSDCATGSDSCRRLGIKAASSTSNGSNSSSNDNSNAIAFCVGKFNWMAVLLATAAVSSFLK